MDRKTDPSTDDVIDRIYEVAVDPSRYERLLDHWEAMIAPRRTGAPTRPPEVVGLDALAGHLERADQVLDRVIASDRAKGPQPLLDAIECSAAFAIDHGLRVVACNQVAADLFELQGRPAARDLSLPGGAAGEISDQAARLFRTACDAPVVIRARSDGCGRVIVFHLRRAETGDGESYVLVISSDVHWPDGFSDMLRGAFDLTPAEADVLRLLTRGQTLQQIAETRSRSLDTVRAQLKSIMAKTETRSQTELVRLTLSTLEITHFSHQATRAETELSRGYDRLAPLPFQRLTLPDGRRMDFLILGDTAGRPLLYSPLDYGLVRWPASAEAEAARRGIRVIVPVRAGYGSSDPIPRAAPYVPQLCDDLAALLDHLGVARAPFLTLGGDSHIAARFNSLHPERMTALVACAGVLPLTRTEHYERMDKWHRFILAGARFTPHLLPFMVKAGFALAHKLGKVGFLKAVYSKSRADMHAIADAEIREALLVGSDVALSDTHSAHDAFAREVIAHETTDWTDAVRDLEDRVPVTFMNGLQDPQVAPETLADFKQDYPWIDFEVFPDAGQLLFFANWQAVLDRLEPHLAAR
ncbi:alpha/beta fold hydrolase [Thalassorhabdomicrobium marinisediminis]|uniref:Helix-turn-helix transcriptional regulator n=1 Tax=Thalassorhabdomicrobium marinisediminis TaxID=2170577 RepID=A0A2T7FXX8_9RHOB|nr:alpha/beta fold hydrolase [Thalassorhabdomicrobium marinisediminis]PVA07024.1 helix-turn-helix transcriptional regulator [Thalassorhabdomicrobium marinisediminis]